MNRLVAVGLILCACPTARADEWEQKRLKEDLNISDIVVIDADPGREKVGAMKPTWCDLTDKYAGQVMGSRLVAKLQSYEEKGWQRGNITDVAEILCAHPDAPDWQKQTGYVVQAWVNLTGLNKADALAAIRARVDRGRWDRELKQTCEGLSVPSEASDERKRLNGVLRETFGCDYGYFWSSPTSQMGDKLEWYLDRRAEIPSEIMRSYYVLACLGDGEKLRKDELGVLAGYARCGVDARGLDRRRLDRELDQGGYNPTAKVIAREQLARARLVEQRFRRVVDALVRDDELYRKLFLEVPEAAFAAWAKDYEANKDAIEAAYAFEAKLYGPSRKAMQGCATELRKHFLAHLRAKKPKTVEEAQAAATDHVGMILLGSLLACEAAEGNANTMKMLASLYEKGRVTRGPRFAAYYAVLDALTEILADRERFPLRPEMLGYKGVESFLERGGKICAASGPADPAGRRSCPVTVGHDVKGTVVKVAKVAEGVAISFKTEKWREEEVECSDTNQIWRIDSGGVKYFQSCKLLGYKTVSHTEKTTIVPATASEGISKGMYFMGSGDYPYDDPSYKRLGYPVTVFKDKNRKQLVSFYGFAL